MNAPVSFSSRTGRSGFVLFEVLIALTIFITVAFSIVLALDAAYDAAKDRNNADVAIRGLQNQMAMLNGARIIPGERDMPDDGSGVQYHIVVIVEQMKDQKNEPLPNMLRATITASWLNGKFTEDRSVTELIYQP